MLISALPPLLLALGLFCALWPWAGRYDDRPWIRLTATMVLTSAVIVLLTVGLGALHLLGRTSLALAALTVIGLLILGTRFFRRPAGAALTTGHDRCPPSWWTRWTGLPALGRSSWTIAGLVAGVYFLVALISALIPPYGWDTHVYHLTIIFQAAQTGALDIFPFPGPQFYFPFAGEMHSLWAFLLSGPGPDSWRLTGSALLPFGLTFGAAAGAAATALGFERSLRWLVPGALLAPVVLIQPLSGYVDLPFAAFTMAAFAFALLAAREGRFGHWVGLTLAAGLALATKLAFLYYALPVAVVLLARPAIGALFGHGMKRAALRLGLLLLLFALPAGFWLGRNWILFGNPFYPTALKIAGLSLFKGPVAIQPNLMQQAWFVPNTISWLRYPFFETSHGTPTYTLENGFGPLFAAGVLANLAGLVWALIRRRWDQLRWLLALPLTVLCWLKISPYQEPRYIIAAHGFGLLALAWWSELIPEEARWPRWLFHGTATLAIAFGTLGGLGSLGPDLEPQVREWRAGRNSPEQYIRSQYGVAGEAMNALSAPEWRGKTITFPDATFIAPLFGWHGRNRVVYAAFTQDPPVGSTPRVVSYPAWRHFLREEKVDGLLVWRPWWGDEGNRQAEEWIGQHPEEFQLVRTFGEGDGARARLYRFTPSGGGQAPEPLSELDDPAAWQLEFQTGAESRRGPRQQGPGLRIDFQFKTRENDYLDYRAALGQGDWSVARYLSFDISAPPSSTLMFLYLKDQDPRESCRFRIDLRDLPGPTTRLRLDLADPDRATPGFDIKKVAEIHIVLDDYDDDLTGSGAVEVGRFRIESADVPASPAKTGAGDLGKGR